MIPQQPLCQNLSRCPRLARQSSTVFVSKPAHQECQSASSISGITTLCRTTLLARAIPPDRGSRAISRTPHRSTSATTRRRDCPCQRHADLVSSYVKPTFNTGEYLRRILRGLPGHSTHVRRYYGFMSNSPRIFRTLSSSRIR